MLPYVDLVFDYPARLTGASIDERTVSHEN